MDEKELLKKQGEHLAEVLNVIDGDGKRFEFETLYYFTVTHEKDGKRFVDVKSVETKYQPLAFKKVSNDSLPEYRLSEKGSIKTNRMYREPHTAIEMALLQVAKNREETLETIQSQINEVLTTFSRDIKHYDEMKQLLEDKLQSL